MRANFHWAMCRLFLVDQMPPHCRFISIYIDVLFKVDGGLSYLF